MQRGIVKFFLREKGYGFITSEDGGPDVFVHCKELHKAGIQTASEGMPIQFEAGPGKDGKLKALKVEAVR